MNMWKFEPILKTTIWGGDKIKSFKNIDTDLQKIGESWEVSDIEGSESVVSEGVDKGLTINQLIEKYGADNLLGAENHKRFGKKFPLLVKFIDAQQDLSVQVHPDDVMAQRHGMDNGKTEMWYVISADKDAKLVNGFNRYVDADELRQLIDTGHLEDVLNYTDIDKGDIFFIPAGRVHAIGKGAFIAEIQQTSDATYRLYDYNRTDDKGNKRELHVDNSLEAIDYANYDGSDSVMKGNDESTENRVESQYFTTEVKTFTSESTLNLSKTDSFVILIATEGNATIKSGSETSRLSAGDTLLIPAEATEVTILPDSGITMLMTKIE